MIKLITLVDEVPVFNPEVRMFAPFRKILERDRGKYSERGVYEKGDHDGRKKVLATKELVFIYWFADPRSPYKETYNDTKLRIKKIKELLEMPDEWQPDEVVATAVEFYLNEIKEDFDIKYLEGAIAAASKTTDYFNAVDYTAMDSKGKRLFSVKEVTDALKNSSAIIEDLRKIRDKIFKSEKLARQVRGGGSIGRFEE